MEKIIVENLYKIFGPQPRKAIELLKKGQSKEEIFDKTGMTVGVNNASFSINQGEIFVIMGLSGSGKRMKSVPGAVGPETLPLSTALAVSQAGPNKRIRLPSGL